MANAREEFVRRSGRGRRIGRCKQCAEQIIDCQLHVGIDRRGCRLNPFESIVNNFVKETPRGCSAVPVSTALRLISEMGNQRSAGQKKGEPLHARIVGDALYGPGRVDERANAPASSADISGCRMTSRMPAPARAGAPNSRADVAARIIGNSGALSRNSAACSAPDGNRYQ